MENYSELHKICLTVFESVTKTTSVFVLPLFLGRIVFSNIMAEGSNAFAAVKGAVIYFCLIAGFPLILEILFAIPNSYLPNLQENQIATANPGVTLSLLPYGIDRLMEAFLALAYWVVYYLHIFFMIMMCSMAPIVFLLGAMLGIGLGLEVFLGLLIIASSWPVVWYGFNQVQRLLITNNSDAFGTKCLELILTILKGASPVAFSAMAISSPAGKMVTGGLSLTKEGYSLAKEKLTSHSNAYKENLSSGIQSQNSNATSRADHLSKYSKSHSSYANKSEFQSRLSIDRLERANRDHSGGLNEHLS